MTTDAILTDLQIAALTPEQRRELITRLRQPISDMIDPVVLNRMRRIRLSLMIGGSIAMIPWLAYLSMTLPENYVAHNWTATWLGFDALLVGFMLATAVFGYLRRQVLLLAAFTSGVLLICDAWFDLMTAGPNDVRLSLDHGVRDRAAVGDLPDQRRSAGHAAHDDAPLAAGSGDVAVAAAAVSVMRGPASFGSARSSSSDVS